MGTLFDVPDEPLPFAPVESYPDPMQRRGGIGGSDAPAVLGVSPYMTPYSLWAKKRGLLPDEPTNAFMRAGTVLEAGIAQLFAEQEGVEVAVVDELLKDPELDYLYGRVDRAIVGQMKGLEVKMTGSSQGWGTPYTDEVPPGVKVQVQHYMMLTGWESFYISALIMGRGPVTYIIPRDDAFIADLRAAEVEFWGWVQSGIEPPIDGSEATRKAIGLRWPQDTGIELVATPEQTWMIEALRLARERVAEAEDLQGQYENQIKTLMGEATALLGPGARITWKTTSPITRVDWKLVAADYRGMIEQMALGTMPMAVEPLTAAATIESLHTAVSPGQRRFLARFTGEKGEQG